MIRKSLLAITLASLFPFAGYASEFYVVVPNQGKDDFTHLTDVVLTPLALPSGKVGEPYAGFNFNSILSVTGDPNFTSEQVVWSVAAGQLPEGLTLNADGTLTGTPTLGTTAEGQGFTIRAAYLSKNDTELYRVTVKVAIALAGATLPEGIVGQPYPGVDLKPLVEVDGDAGFTANAVTWSLADGHALPAGLTLNANGTITGTPSAAFTGDVRVVASYQDEAASQQYRFVTLALNVALANATAPQGIVGQPYAGFDLRNYLTVTGDPAFKTDAVTWELVSGALPAGLTFNATTGAVTGAPSEVASRTVTFRATYKNESGEQSYQFVTLSLNVALTNATAPQGIVGQAYAGFNLRNYLTVTGDPAFDVNAVSWSLAEGVQLPAGLTLNPNGTVSGTPTVAGTQPVTFRATYRGVSGQQSYSLVTLSIGVSLATATAPQGIVGQAYAGFNLRDYLTVSGDASFNSGSAVTWSVASGTLPAGLTLNTSTGVVSGTPTAAASSTVTFRATYRGVSGQQSYSLVTLSIGVSLATATAPQGIVGQVYAGFNLRDYLTVSGDASFNSGSAVTWSVASGTLPAGLTLNTSTGVVSGTPTAAASSTVTFRATYRGVSGQQSYSLVTLNIVLTLASATLPEGKSGTAYSYDFKTLLSATGDASFTTSKATFSLSGSLPSGLSLSSAGVLAGTPSTTTAGQNFTVNASYRGVSASRAYNIKVTSASFIFNPTIASNTNNYNLRNAAVAAGWNGTTPLNATVTINSGVTVGSSSTATPAFDTGTSFPAGSKLILVNNGRIAGAGGKGGSGGVAQSSTTAPTAGSPGGVALKASAVIEVRNYGTVAGGGGGGGGGGFGGYMRFYFNGYSCSPMSSGKYGGGGGGGGAGSVVGAGGSGGTGINGNGTAGTGGTLTAAGAGGNSGNASYAGKGGAAGAPGSAGSAGANGVYNGEGDCNNQTTTNAGAAGGAAGAAVVGNSNITWTAAGTRLGPVN